MKKLSLLCLAGAMLVLALATAVGPGAAGAAPSASDRNGDRLPDSWERRNGLSLRLKQTYRDTDRDGLNNLREYRHRTNPRSRDTDRDGLRDGQEIRTGHDPRRRDDDDDGVRDGNERAGTVASFDSVTGVLVINLATGGTATGRVVTGVTELECENENENEDSRTPSNNGPGSANSGPGNAGDDDHGDDDDNDNDDHGDDDNDDNDRGDDDDDGGDRDRCPAGALRAGAIVHEAELKFTSAGAIWDEIELL